MKDTSKYKIALIVSHFNENVTTKLAQGAKKLLIQKGVSPKKIDEFSVPGAWEIPYVAHLLGKKKSYDALIGIAVVIQGATEHHRHVADQCFSQMSKISLDYSIPFGNCVLTCRSMEEALERAGGKVAHRGEEAAQAVIEVLGLRDRLLSS